LALDANGADLVRSRVRETMAARGEGSEYREQGYLLLRRGPYVIVAAPAGGDGGRGELLRLSGAFVDLFDARYSIRSEIVLHGGECKVLLDLGAVTEGPLRRDPTVETRHEAHSPCVLAASARIGGEQASDTSLQFHAAGPLGTIGQLLLRLPQAPRSVTAGSDAVKTVWDPLSHTALLRHPNRPEGTDFVVQFA
jgi:hypothetical protein